MMKVFAYNFPHWKTQAGLFNLFLNGLIPDLVMLQDKKKLDIPHSDYRVVPRGEYLADPVDICRKLNIKYKIMDHEDSAGGGLGVILGARILSHDLINRYDNILNIHPGILPGNRGLDNLKHSIIKRLPIGVTAHIIDHRIDMGTIIDTRIVPVYQDDTIRDVYIRQRNCEQELLIDVIKKGIYTGTPCTFSEKFTVITPDEDLNLHHDFATYKKYHESSRLPAYIRIPAA